MDPQLRRLLDGFHEYDIDYWVDSGTLLGLIREEALLDDESDIDVSTGLWREDHHAVEEVVRHLVNVDEYNTYDKYTYYGSPFNFTLRTNEGRDVDIKLFRRAGSHDFVPERLYLNNTYPKTTPQHYYLRFFRRIAMTYRHYKYQGKETRFPPTWLGRFLVKNGTWWIPHKYFEDIQYLEEYDACVPHQYETYLTYKYEDWEVPNTDWNWRIDDKTLRRVPPDELLGRETVKDKMRAN